MTNADAQSPYPLNTLTPDGKAPKSRLDDASVAQQIYWNTHQANLGRNNYGAYLQGVCDGNPPYRQSSLRASGQGWRANFSTKESKARKNSGKTPYYDLFASGPSYAEVRTKVKDEITADEASGIITEEWHLMLEQWSGFEMNVWKMIDSFVGFGRGWLFWPNSDVWHFKSLPWWRVRFPDGTDVDPSEWSMFTVQHNYDPVNLNGFIRDEKIARKAGWNPVRVREAIKTATPIDPQSTRDQMMVQQMIMDQDIQLMYRSSTVQAASVFVKEFDGTWTRMIVETGGSDGGTDKRMDKGDWLFYKRGVAKNIHELIAPFIFEVETGSINGLTGILSDITDQVKAANRLFCEQLNNGFLRSTIIMQPQTASSRVKSGLITVGGGVTLVPEGMTVQPSTIMGDIESSAFILQEMRRDMDINTGIFRPQMEKPAGNPEPLGTTQLRYAQASVLTNSAVNRFYQQLDWFYAELYRRSSISLPDSKNEAIKAARDFQKRCRDRGVTDKQLRDISYVRAVRVIGNGSPAMRAQLTAEIAGMLPVLNLGQRGQDALAKIIISSRGGQDMVDRLKPMEDQENMPTEQDRQALLENDSIKGGSPVVVVENDNHMVHLRYHFGAAIEGLQAVSQGAPPDDVAAFVQGMLPHAAQHIQMIKNPEEQKEAVKVFKEIEGQNKQLIAQIQQAQPDPEQQQQVMSKTQLDQVMTMSKIQNQNIKTQASLRDKEMKSEQARRIQAAEATQRMGLADAETAAKIRRETFETVTSARNGESGE
jgi:hypothetical protein